MKKTFAILIAIAALAFAACTKTEVPASEDSSKLVFSFTVNYPEATKAVKAGWEAGDKVFIFFEGVFSGYVTMEYSGSAWGAPAVAGSITVDELSESGSTLSAIYLPYGNDATATWSSSETRWTFTEGKTDSYYLSYQGSYTVDKSAGFTTIAADCDMIVSSGYVQFFIPDAEATGTIRMACNAFKPAGLAWTDVYDIHETNGVTGGFVTGYAATVNGAKGWYFSCKIATPRKDENNKYLYYFAVEAGANNYDYFARLDEALITGKARRLPALTSMHQVGSGYYATIGSNQWSTVNHGAAKPWEYEPRQFLWSELGSLGLLSSESVPTETQLNSLLTDANRCWLTLGDVEGMLFVDNSDATHYIFVPDAGFSNNGTPFPKDSAFLWSTTESGDDIRVLTLLDDSPNYSWSNLPKTETTIGLSVRAVK